MKYRTLEIFSFNDSLLAVESTRQGGVSEPPFHSLNLSPFTRDCRDHVLANQRLLYAAVHIDESQIAGSFQCHGTEVLHVLEPGHYEGYDALMTRKKDIFLQILVADCTPVLLYDPKNEVVAAIHAGWRGTVNGIVTGTLKEMTAVFKTNPSDCYAYVGTCISQSFFEVDEDVASYFNKDFVQYDENKGKFLIDLKQCHFRSLIHAGLPENHVSVSPYCTIGNNELFFSHRHEQGTTGRFGVLIGMRQ
jgi:YfiH family protein